MTSRCSEQRTAPSPSGKTLGVNESVNNCIQARVEARNEGEVMITAYSFGTMTVSGRKYGKDLKIINSEVASDWWRKEGHLLQETDLEGVLSAAPQVLVVGTGAYGAMRVDGGLRALLEERGIELIAEPTARAVETFNRLVSEGRDAAGAFHLTC